MAELSCSAYYQQQEFWGMTPEMQITVFKIQRVYHLLQRVFELEQVPVVCQQVINAASAACIQREFSHFI